MHSNNILEDLHEVTWPLTRQLAGIKLEFAVDPNAALPSTVTLRVSDTDGVTISLPELSREQMHSLARDLAYIANQIHPSIVGDHDIKAAEVGALAPVDAGSLSALQAASDALQGRRALLLKIRLFLEQCPDESAQTLDALLSTVRPSGRFPFGIASNLVKGGFVPTINAPTGGHH